MMKKIFWIVLIFSMLLASCQSPTETPVTPSATPTIALPPPELRTTSVPEAQDTAKAFLNAWKSEEYETMYGLLSSESQAGISQEDFARYFGDIAFETSLNELNFDIHSAQIHPTYARVDFRIILDTFLAGEIQDETGMDLVLDQGQWRVQWSDTIVHSGLSGDHYLKMDRTTSSRANIYDRNGNLLAGPSDAIAFGIWPDQIIEDEREELYVQTSRLTGIPVENVLRRIEGVFPGIGTYLPFGVYTPTEVARRGGGLGRLSGVVLREYSSARFYPDGGIAPHAVGYVAAITQEDLNSYRRRGFNVGELVGQRGLELWGQDVLLGKRGGTLYVRNAEGQPVLKLGETPSTPPQEIYSTIDQDFQRRVQQALEGYGFRGAVVVMERDTGRVLAMASTPSFDPNAFTPGNFNAATELNDIFNPAQPLFNRAAEGQYPLGSVFKIVTLAAALESGVFTPDSTYECGYFFEELPGITLTDWTYERFQEDGEFPASGQLTLPQGLIRSCNPFFYHIGLSLFDQELRTAISDMAKGFGLGQLTGIESVQEQAGVIPEPQERVEATSLAIGQGNTQVTPLQVARFVAAIGNGGTLYKPQLVEQIAPAGGEPSYTFQPEAQGELPVSDENLEIIQNAMRGVVESTTPRGTAYHVFNGLRIPVAGKTGTAESGGIEPHAWFAGYTLAEREDRPDIAIAVVVEFVGDGSDFAAPIFRRVVEIYFRGQPAKLYPWEEAYGVLEIEEPEEEGEATPTPEDGSSEEGSSEETQTP